MPRHCVRTQPTTAKAMCQHQSSAIPLQQALNIRTQQKHKKKTLKANFMKMIKVLKEEMNKTLEEIQENKNKQLEAMEWMNPLKKVKK